MNVLNLYSGIGGNRKLWTNCQVTAIEKNEKISAIYKDFFPDDNVIIADAHQYLLDNYRDYDFIWSSPPCPTHSRMKFMCTLSNKGSNKNRKAEYPDMALYQEIILLKHFAKKDTLWVVENVDPYYIPLIPAFKRERHLFWSNFYIPEFKSSKSFKIRSGTPLERINDGKSEIYGFYINNYDITDKRRILRNLVNPELGLHIFNCMSRQRKQAK